LARPGQLSPLERPNHDFARYISKRASDFAVMNAPC
jgi:hypothetical protein